MIPVKKQVRQIIYEVLGLVIRKPRLKKYTDKLVPIVFLVVIVCIVMGGILGLVSLVRQLSTSDQSSDFSTKTSVYLRGYPADKNFIDLNGKGTLRPFDNFKNSEPERMVTLARNMTISVLGKRMAPQSNGSAYSYVEKPKNEDVFTFYQTPNKGRKNFHVIETGGSKFLVTLINIVPVNEDFDESMISTTTTYQQYVNGLNFEYQFIVSEL